jgi:hypothetical protein
MTFRITFDSFFITQRGIAVAGLAAVAISKRPTTAAATYGRRFLITAIAVLISTKWSLRITNLLAIVKVIILVL